jgi:Uma2 family endonuclease
MLAHGLLPEERPARLPTMYDLPSEDPEDPGLPDEFHHYQPQLLRETFVPAAYPPEQVFIGTDINLYYDPSHVYWYKRPDWFAAVGNKRFYLDKDLRLSYVVWDEPCAPFIVVELLSPGTEKEDLGETPDSAPDAPPGKWAVYEKILKIPYYAVFSRYTDELKVFCLEHGVYREMSVQNGRVWLPELRLGLGLWQGKFDPYQERLWLRCYDEDGAWIPTQAEKLARAQRAATQARWKTQQEHQRAEQERQRAEQESERAEQERQRADALAAKLRELGLDPDELK